MPSGHTGMISLRSYLFREGDEGRDGLAEIGYRRVIDLFLQGIALHAVEGEQGDYERFRAEIDALGASLAPETPLPQLFVIAGGAVRAMEEYNRRASKFLRQQKTELRHMVSMLTQTRMPTFAAWRRRSRATFTFLTLC